jgi:hypothetical protein
MKWLDDEMRRVACIGAQKVGIDWEGAQGVHQIGVLSGSMSL